MKHALLLYSALLFLVPAYPASAQDGDSETGQEETPTQDGSQGTGSSEPVVIEQQPYEYYYWPEEDLDNFGLSTLGQGRGGSTLGRSLQRKSNIEVNAPEGPAKGEDDTEGGPEDSDQDTDLLPPDETGDGSASIDEAPPASPKESEFYEWVDERGNVHITNNLGDVPPEKQEEIYKRKSLPGGE